MKEFFGAGLVVLVFLAIVLFPFAFIWAWNTLFGVLHTIDYTFQTWLATLLLASFFKTGSYKSKD